MRSWVDGVVVVEVGVLVVVVVVAQLSEWLFVASRWTTVDRASAHVMLGGGGGSCGAGEAGAAVAAARDAISSLSEGESWTA